MKLFQTAGSDEGVHGESRVKRLPGTAPVLPLGPELSEQLGRNPLHFSDP